MALVTGDTQYVTHEKNTMFPDHGSHIGQQHFFLIWQDCQTPHPLFFTNVYPSGPTGKQSILGSQIEEKTHLLHYAKTANIVVKNFQHLFSKIGPNKGELLFGYWQHFFYKINFYHFFPDFETQIGQQHFFMD